VGGWGGGHHAVEKIGWKHNGSIISDGLKRVATREEGGCWDECSMLRYAAREHTPPSLPLESLKRLPPNEQNNVPWTRLRSKHMKEMANCGPDAIKGGTTPRHSPRTPSAFRIPLTSPKTLPLKCGCCTRVFTYEEGGGGGGGREGGTVQCIG
jgi:hypothetical protein